MLLSQGLLTGAGGVLRSAQDQRLGDIVMALLCQGSAEIGGGLAGELAGDLAPFIAHGLAAINDGRLTIMPGGLPYARTIAALFDPYRKDAARRFSSAV